MNVLLHALGQTDLDISQLVSGFSGTLPLMKKGLPGKESYALSALYANVTGKDLSAHDAAEDVQALSELLEASGVDATVLAATVSLSSAQKCVRFRVARNDRKKTNSGLVEKKVLSMGIA